jgi:hypothetical protein
VRGRKLGYSATLKEGRVAGDGSRGRTEEAGIVTSAGAYNGRVVPAGEFISGIHLPISGE